MFFKYAGSAFHAVGPETANPRGPKVLVNVRGMMRSPRAAERCDRSAPLSDTRESISERYGGASPRKQRKTSRQSLNEIRGRIGSQCNLFRMSSEMRSYFFFCRKYNLSVFDHSQFKENRRRFHSNIYSLQCSDNI